MPSRRPGLALDNPCVPVSEKTLASKDLLESLRKAFSRLELPDGLQAARSALSELPGTIVNLERRLADGASSPIRVALFGPTGVGKSKIFNSLLGSVVSPAGFKRPFTMRPVYSVHEAHSRLVSRMNGEVCLRTGDFWHDIVLIDTPDFDSVERHNREEAERIFLEADAFLFVTDVQKYADQSTWQYLDRISAEKKPAIIVLNKAASEGAESDFRARVHRSFPGNEVLVLAERPIDDATLIPPDDPTLCRIGARVTEIFGPPAERRALMISAFRSDLARLLQAWRSVSTGPEAYFEGVESLRIRLNDRFARASETLPDEVSAPLAPSVKAEVYERVLERIQSIDILRYPRRLLALPFEGLRLLVSKWWPSRRESSKISPEEASRNQAFQILESKLLALLEETRADFQSEARCPLLLSSVEALALRIPHGELAEIHRQKDEEFRAWLEREARETASRLTSENKLKFILSQVIYNSIAVGIQIHTAGHFTLFEAATDGVLSPLFAKAVGMAVSSEKVAQFEKTARDERARLLTQVLSAGKSPLEQHLSSRVAWRKAFGDVASEMKRLEAHAESFVQCYEAGSSTDAQGSPALAARSGAGGVH